MGDVDISCYDCIDFIFNFLYNYLQKVIKGICPFDLIMIKTDILLPKTIAQSEMRMINRSAVLEYFRLAHTASRTEISEYLELSRPTVMRIIDQLIEEGLVISTGKKESGKGRSRELLSLNTKENAVIGIDVGGSHISGALIDLGGTILLESYIPQQWDTPNENFTRIINFIQTLLEQSRQYNAHLLGIGIGIPGIVSSKTGEVKRAPSLGWVNFPLLKKLRPLLDMPIFIENDVSLAALGEYWFGAGVGINNIVMISIGTGIGAGIILDGKLYRGHTDSAGEIGYILPGVQYLDNQYPGFGALEKIASGKGISDRAKEVLRASQSDVDLSKVDALFVFDAAQDGNQWATQIIDETIDYLSLMIANISVSFDPELIILGGGVAGSVDMLIAPILTRLEGVIPTIPKLKVSMLKNNAPILGAVVQVFHKITDYSVIYIA